MKILKAIDTVIERFARYALVADVALMLGFSILVIVLRWFDKSLLWVEPFVRHLVFLGAFLGGIIATGRKTHIGIDIIGKYLESKQMREAHRWVGRIISLASSLVLVWLIRASFDFVSAEAEYGKVVFLGIHSKYLVSIAPVGFGLISYRFFYLFVHSFTREGRQKNEEVA